MVVICLGRDLPPERDRPQPLLHHPPVHDTRHLSISPLPAEGAEFFFGADELHGAVVEQDTAALGVVVVEREQLRPAVLVPPPPSVSNSSTVSPGESGSQSGFIA